MRADTVVDKYLTGSAAAGRRPGDHEKARLFAGTSMWCLESTPMGITSASLGDMRLGAIVSSNSRGLARLASRVSSGKRIVSAADDAAGLGVASSLDAHVRTTRTAIQAQDGIAVAEVATRRRGRSQTRFSACVLWRCRPVLPFSPRRPQRSRPRVLGHAYRDCAFPKRRSISLANGTNPQIAVQVGIDSSSNSQVNIRFGRLTAVSLGLSAANVDLRSESNARSSIDVIDSALQSVSSTRSRFGATVNRLEASIGASQGLRDALASASARLIDADYAKVTSEFTKAQILMVAGGASMLHHRRIEQQALRLLS